jgi:hypothetical protein
MKHHFYKTLINQRFWFNLILDEFRGYIPHTSSTMGMVIPIYQGDCNTRFIAEIYVK